MTQTKNKLIQKITAENKESEKKLPLKYFKKIVITDPIILFPDQWERLKNLAEEIVPAGEQSSIDDLYNHAVKEGKPVCWTQLAAKPLQGKELKEKIQGADAIISCWTSIHDDVLINSPNLKYIGYWTNLAEHRVNLNLAKKQNIKIDWVPDYGTQAVASQTLTGILATLRNLPQEIKMTEKGKWHHELLKTRQRVPLTEDQIPQDDLWYKKVGIIGMGPIGEQVTKLLQPFECEVSYWSRKKRSKKTEEELNIKFEEMKEIFSSSDIISIHLSPYAGEKIISKQLIESMKPKSIFINTSAGGLIDQDALFKKLHQKNVKAYLDVYEGLPPKEEIRNLQAKGNIFTYRSGWFTKSAVRLKGEKFLKNMEKYIASQ